MHYVFLIGARHGFLFDAPYMRVGLIVLFDNDM